MIRSANPQDIQTDNPRDEAMRSLSWSLMVTALAGLLLTAGGPAARAESPRQLAQAQTAGEHGPSVAEEARDRARERGKEAEERARERRKDAAERARERSDQDGRPRAGEAVRERAGKDGRSRASEALRGVE